MHLDTVFTMVDKDKFTIHPEIEGPLTVYSIRKGEKGDLVIEQESMVLRDLLMKYLELDDVKLIRCGGNAALMQGVNSGMMGPIHLQSHLARLLCIRETMSQTKFLKIWA